jgi:hypothetical protein
MELYSFYKAAIRALAPEGVWCLYNNSLEGMEWRSEEVPPPSIEEIESKAQELYDEYMANPPEPVDPPMFIAGSPQ